MAKSQPAHVAAALRKRDQLYDHYAAIGTGPAKVAELVGVDVVEATRELRKRATQRAQAGPGGSAVRSPA